MKASSSTGEIWGLGGGQRAGRAFKLVVRATGSSGTFTAYALDPDGNRQPASDVIEHPGSNFDRPGDEWGMGFEFDRAGCWQIVVERGNVKGTFTLFVPMNI